MIKQSQTTPHSSVEEDLTPALCTYQVASGISTCDGCLHTATCPRLWENSDLMDWIQKNKGLLVHTYKSFINNNSQDYTSDDVAQESYISVLKAAKSFDPAKNVSFNTYASKAIRNNLLGKIRKDGAQKRTTPDGRGILALDDSPSENHDCSDNYGQKMESISPDSAPCEIDDDLMAQDLEKLIFRIAQEECSKEETQLLEILVGSVALDKTYTQDQISKKLKCSQAKVSSLLKILRGKLRLALEEYGYFC